MEKQFYRENQRPRRVSSIFKEKNKVGGLMLPDFETSL